MAVKSFITLGPGLVLVRGDENYVFREKLESTLLNFFSLSVTVGQNKLARLSLCKIFKLV
jgi:hypothetical protein